MSVVTENIFDQLSMLAYILICIQTQCDASRSEAITQLVCCIIGTHILPISVGESERFKELVPRATESYCD